MCGIAGIFLPYLDRRHTSNKALVEAMTNAIAHRGPDGSGVHLEPHIGMGHRRLAIIDIATGQQPLFNEDNSVCVVYNGEIYNFQTLAGELEKLGHVFKTKSDTEVIVHAWEEWGRRCVERFRGMFAFALWDRNSKTFFLARDRLGVKPLYYGKTLDGDILFGSELKALTVHPRLNRDLRSDAADDYFAYGYVPDPKTILNSCHKLPPGHTLSWELGNREPVIWQYWKASFEATANGSIEDLSAELRERVSESVKLRMISEVPIGAFLSGGVDSSAVVSAMSGHANQPVTTLSIGFDSKSFDETEYAQKVASAYGTNHFSRQVTIDDFDLIDDLAGVYDEPFADSSAIPTFRVCQLARERVTVALSGDGGDETFGGYRRYKMHLAEERMRSMLPGLIRQPVFSALGKVYPKADWAPRAFRAKTTFQALALDAVCAYQNAVGCVRTPQRKNLYSSEFNSALGEYDPFSQAYKIAAEGPRDPLAMLQNLDYHMYLPGDINVKVDRASMRNSLETREPLMDHELVEWASTLPSSVKIRAGETKFLFKKAYEKQLPNDVLYHPKMGFSVPLAQWFKGRLKTDLEHRMTGSFAGGLLDPQKIQVMLNEHSRGARDWSTPLWAILMFDAFSKNLERTPFASSEASELSALE